VLISAALEEWKSDSTDASIAKACGRMPAPKGDLGAKMEKCAAAASCTAFNECVIPLMGQTMGR